MNARFLDLLDIRQIGWKNGRPLFLTLAPLRYQCRLGTITVPAEFITDLASTPRVPLLWLAAGGCGPRSAVVHDAAYQFGFWLIGESKVTVEKSLVDTIFWESLRADPISGVGQAKAWMMWAGVRVGGHGVWADERRTASLNPIWFAESKGEAS